jgi:tetratricopeptide (TPR) repeat protein
MANYDRAIELYEEGLELYKTLPYCNMEKYQAMGLDLAQLILNKGGKHRHASKVMLDILMEATTNPNPDLGHIINLGLVYRRENQLSDAEKCFRTALLMVEKKSGPYSDSTIDIVQHLANSLHDKSQPSDLSERFRLLFRAWVIRNIRFGSWHVDTLQSLHDLGVVLLQRHRYGEAGRLLHSVFLGRQNRLGVEHPDTQETILLLQGMCEKTRNSTPEINTWNDEWLKLKYGRLHYEHEVLFTIADLIAWIDQDRDRFSKLQRILEDVLEEQQRVFGKGYARRPECLRALAGLSQCFYLQDNIVNAEKYSRACFSLQKDIDEAEKSWKRGSKSSQTSDWNSGETYLRMCDLSIILLQSSTVQAAAEAQLLSQSAFFGLLEVYGPSSYQLESCKNRLDKYGLLRWNFEFDMEDKIPFEILGIIGKGVSGVVHAVTWRGKRSQRFAQKLFHLPKDKRRDATMKAIDNEINAIQMFKAERHVVKIEYTYRVANGYAIIMSPLAEEDLQSFLERQHTPQSSAITTQTSQRMRSWFICLAKTLASIHERKVRHKDIKPRNILISNGSILFADFGSSSLFTSELTSSTEGTVGGGNTRLYSPPEVICEGRRGRSADVFSLGCVFSEIATVLAGKTLADFHKFRLTRYKDELGEWVETRMFQKSLDKVDEWFRSLKTLPEYEAFIKPMLAADRDARPSAAEVASKILTFYQGDGRKLKTSCKACC